VNNPIEADLQGLQARRFYRWQMIFPNLLQKSFNIFLYSVYSTNSKILNECVDYIGTYLFKSHHVCEGFS
jgi:hypothetical protein